jgi:hypothetical protein
LKSQEEQFIKAANVEAKKLINNFVIEKIRKNSS